MIKKNIYKVRLLNVRHQMKMKAKWAISVCVCVCVCVLDPVRRPKAGLWMEIEGANRDWKAITHTLKGYKGV